MNKLQWKPKMGGIHSTSVLWRTVTREESSKYRKGNLVTQGKWGSELRSKCLEMWKYVHALGTASNALQLEHRMGLGGSGRWGWEVNCEELCLPSCRFPTPVPICSDTAVVQKGWAAKNSIKTRIFIWEESESSKFCDQYKVFSPLMTRRWGIMCSQLVHLPIDFYYHRA